MTQKLVSLKVDFISGALAHRRKFGGGKSQLIAKAVGIKPKIFPSVLDLTAGLGKDAFVLASLGCQVTLVERHPLVFDALQQGFLTALRHAKQEDPVLLSILQRMTVLNEDGITFLKSPEKIQHQVIYLDPMFPERTKSAAVKKDMVLLQAMVGGDEDSAILFQEALQAPVSRIVVKRPKRAAPLCDTKPSLVFQGQSSRFDVYPKKALA